MKIKIFIMAIFLLAGCSSTKIDTTPPVLGKITKNILMDEKFSWFAKNYSDYKFKQNVIDSISQFKGNGSVVVFMGTWCDDSKREIPKFFKICESAGLTNFEIFGLDRKKKSPDSIEVKYKIEKVPTFIFFKNDKESGRIIEFPDKTLEEDILKYLLKD